MKYFIITILTILLLLFSIGCSQQGKPITYSGKVIATSETDGTSYGSIYFENGTKVTAMPRVNLEVGSYYEIIVIPNCDTCVWGTIDSIKLLTDTK
jgi:hypothetical protein